MTLNDPELEDNLHSSFRRQCLPNSKHPGYFCSS